MKIFSGKRLLFDRVGVCDSFISKGVGLMFRRKPLGKRECLLFVFGGELPPALLGIHMSFCFFPITVAWLDSGGKIVDVQGAVPASFFRPETQKVYYPKRPAKYIVECSPETKLKVGQKLALPID